MKTSHTVGGNVKWCRYCGNQQFLSMLNKKSTHEPTIPLLGTNPRECKTGAQTETCTQMFIPALFTLNQKEGTLQMPIDKMKR